MNHVHLKVINGTRSVDAPRLCDTCHYALIRRGPAESQETVLCRRSSNDDPIPFRVVECSVYADKRLPSIGDLYQTAWILASDTRKKEIGFIRYDEWKKKNPNDEHAHY